MPNLEIPNSPRLLKVAELAELLKVKPRTIFEMIAQNRILGDDYLDHSQTVAKESVAFNLD